MVPQTITYNGLQIETLGLAPFAPLRKGWDFENGKHVFHAEPIEEDMDLEEDSKFVIHGTTVEEDSRVRAFSCVKI